MTPPSQELNDDQIRAGAQEIMEGREFQELETSYAFEKWIRKREAWLDSFQDWSAANTGYTWLIITVLLIILIALLTHIIYTTFSDSFGGKTMSKSGSIGSRSMEVLEGKARSWQEGFELARGALEAGKYREAIWISHRVLLGLLDELGCIRFQGYKTNTTYLDELEKNHAWHDLLTRFTRIYEQAIYGTGSLAKDELQTLLSELDLCVRESR